MKEPLKIGLVLDDTLDRPDGVQQYVLTVGRWLAAQGHAVHYLVGKTQSDDPAVHSLSRNVSVRFNRNRMTIPLPASRVKIRKLLAAEGFDVLHVQMPYSPWLAGRVITAAPAATAVVGTFHIVPYSRLISYGNYLLRLSERHTLARFQMVMSVSAAAQSFARQAFHIESSVVPNAIDLRSFDSAWSAATATQPGGLTVTFLGRLVPRKGARLLLEAVAVLRQRADFQTVYRVIIGGRGPLDAELRKFAQQQGLDDVVEFYGFVPEADKARLLAGSDIAVFPSSGGESFGIVLLEAMASSRGVVLAGNNPGYAAVMQPHSEQLFAVNDAAALAERLAYFLSHTAARRAAHTWQRRHVQTYSIESVGPQIVAIYRQALHQTKSMR